MTKSMSWTQIADLAALDRMPTVLKAIDPVAPKVWRRRSVRLLTTLFEELCSLTEVSTLIECGAHGAETSQRFVERTENGRAIALEANPYTFAAKTGRVASDRLIPIAEGIGEFPGELIFHIPETSDGDLMPEYAGFFPWPDASVQEALPVRITTLDELSERFDLSKPVALWVDVEGMAREVFAGGKQSLQNVLIALVEVEPEARWEGSATESEVTELLKSHGFIPVARDFPSPRYFNALYLKAEAVEQSQLLLQRFWDEVLQRPARRDLIRARAEKARKMGRWGYLKFRARLLLGLSRPRP